jgi:hypothetical protein
MRWDEEKRWKFFVVSKGCYINGVIISRCYVSARGTGWVGYEIGLYCICNLHIMYTMYMMYMEINDVHDDHYAQPLPDRPR